MSSKRPIIVARMPVKKTFRNTVAQQIQDAAVASSLARQASFSRSRLIGVQGGVPMYAVRSNTGGASTSRGEVKFFDCNVANANPATFGLKSIVAPPAGSEPVNPFTGIVELNCVAQEIRDCREASIRLTIINKQPTNNSGSGSRASM